MRRFVPALLTLAFAGCNCGKALTTPPPAKLAHDVASFKVELTKISTPSGTPLEGGDGSQAAPYPFPFSNVVFHVKATALDEKGQPYTDFNRPVAMSVTPGDLAPTSRWLPVTGGVAEGDVTVSHVYGRVSIWAIDQEPQPIFTLDGGIPSGAPEVDPLPDGGSPFTHAAGTSPVVWFKSPTIVDTQRQQACDPSKSFSSPNTGVCHTDADCEDAAHHTAYSCIQGTCAGSCDNRLSPLTGDFVSLDQAPPATDMIVTAITQDGFYVTDLKAEKLKAPGQPAYEAAWQALPGKFDSMFVYTYSAPTNLYVGDHLLTLTGSVQEFSGDTQLDFPAWLKVDAEPTPDLIPKPVQIGLAECGVDPNNLGGKGVERLCGYYNSNMALESLESAPVKVFNVKPTTIFQPCDQNGDTNLPLFVNSSQFGGWGCFPDDVLNYPECACLIACATGMPQVDQSGNTLDYTGGDGEVCTELSTFAGFGQWEVEMYDPAVGYDTHTRISVTTRDALTNFNPQVMSDPKYKGITFDISGMLSQVQAARPRWLIYARDPLDVCCHPNPNAPPLPDGSPSGICPEGVRICEAIGQ